MSSGVDSSVAAAMYSRQYRNVEGIFMSNWNQLDAERCLEEDWNDVQQVAEKLDVPITQVSFERDYWLDVFEPMIEGYERGITPNPDINCNRYVKFGKLVDYVTRRYQGKPWWLVTGHYSRILEHESGESHLLRSYYKQKDQSYYLSQINSSVFDRLLLPIGHYTKPEIREMAYRWDLPVAAKPDSTGLCFVNPSQANFHEFLRSFINETPGNIVTEDGNIWGNHDGLWSYTIGQKVGISMPQGDPMYKGSWFVSDKNFETNDIVIVRGGNNEKLFKSVVYVNEFVPLGSLNLFDFPLGELTVQYRSLQQPTALKSIQSINGKLIFQLSEKRRAIANGQYLAVYHRERCLGSGIIDFAE
jgi:tRNA-specific 2-thiouridylase